MSAPGPESIPTSADPRSKRPTKKRAISPTSSQAAHLDALFAKPDQEIRIPTQKRAYVAVPPEIVTNVQGSSAGAGSGEFHVYKAARRREQARLAVMEEEAREEQEKAEFEQARRQREERDAEKTRRNRMKREKKRGKKGKAGEGDADGGEKKGSLPRNITMREESEGGREDEKQDGEERTSELGVDKAVSTANEPGLLIHDDQA